MLQCHFEALARNLVVLSFYKHKISPAGRNDRIAPLVIMTQPRWRESSLNIKRLKQMDTRLRGYDIIDAGMSLLKISFLPH